MGPKTIINKICVSWIAFSPSTANFVSYGGQVSLNQFSGAQSKDISSTVYKSDYTIYGLNLLSITSGKGIAFASEISEDFILSVSSSVPIDSFSHVYVALGAYPSQICASCGAENIINGDVCVSRCPANTYAYTYKDGGVACRTCPSELGLILVGGKCIKGSTTTTTTTTTTVVRPTQTATQQNTQQNTQQTNQQSTQQTTQQTTQQNTQQNTQQTTQQNTQQNTQQTTQQNTQQTTMTQQPQQPTMPQQVSPVDPASCP
jgi:hypothetical protein